MSLLQKKYLITGAAGMVGSNLAARLLQDPENIVTLTDIIEPPIPVRARYPENARALAADLSDGDALVRVVAMSVPLTAVFVFHGIMSGASEANPSLAYRVNFDATRALLLHLVDVQRGVRIIFASSNAVYGPPLPAIVSEATMPTPTGVYGTCKFMVELLINDMHRRGCIDAFSVRFPTISVRPGKPAPAASAFLSSIIREPLNGQLSALPLRDRSFKATLCSPHTCIENLIRVASWKSDVLPRHQRAINFPGIIASVQDLLDALANVAGEDKLALVTDEPHEAYEALLRSWAWNLDYSLPLSLGLKKDESAEGLVREYVESMGS
ncbi:nucleoside-diphosphate-sugar epimerase [Grosmannia clavigera kw1407]|uniref:Nucleoside-diphosphate-sugar epimerase n=1 Tax=Grosmannia clavigera (strain kw1407 / UAMH 11150) TaxID=655863 RepID=F0XNV6_GROCL|nr:nucleoside-diphosphate-sugar epimerase [Grosmannia clavigera kw1407]EFX00621.1 nucleoside-diphosphate-sugar epimerase [Grosmannia clavigera kw1407]